VQLVIRPRVGHPVAVTDGLPKWMRVTTGITLMLAFVLISWAVVARYAGGWGVPYFSFRTDRGSTCTNDLTGYTCTQMTLADLEFYGDVDLPNNTRVQSSTYRSTHDYRLDARLLTPKASAALALKGLQESFGPCQRGHLPPMSTTGLTAVCVMANDDAVTNDAETSSRLYTVGTGLGKDGSRVTVMSVKSR
jgi:hypothetical protein